VLHLPFGLRVAGRASRGSLARLVVVCFLTGLTGGCSQPASANRESVTLQIGVATPAGAVPGSGVRSFVANYLVSEPLLGFGWDGRPVERIASHWEWLPDRLSLRLRIRPQVLFHDGTPLDAALVKQILTGELSRRGAISYRSVTGIDIEGEDTLLLRLSRPEAFLPTDIAGSGVTRPEAPLVGTGPFKLIPTEKNRFAAFDQYHRGRPAIDFVEVKEYEEQRSSWAALMRGDIDAVTEVGPGAMDFVDVKDETTLRPYVFTRALFIGLFFNVRHPVLGKAAVRQALSQAVDREQTIKLGLNGRGIVAEGPIWPFHWAYSTARKAFTSNPEAATLRLDAENLKLRPALERGRMPSRFRFTCLTVANDARYEKIALVLQKQLYDIGVDMEIEVLPLAELVGRTKTGQFDAFLLERNSARSLAWTYMAFHSELSPVLFFADTGYKSADSILERLRSSMTDSDTRAAVGDLQRVFYEDPPAIFLAWPNVARAVDSRFVVPDEAKGRDVLSSLWQWRPAESPR